MGNFEDLFKYINDKAKENKYTPRHSYSALKNKTTVRKISAKKVIQLTAGILASIIVLTSGISLLNKDNETNLDNTPNSSYSGITAPQSYNPSLTKENVIQEQKPLVDVYLETNGSGQLTSDSVKELSSSILHELNDLYEFADGDLPPVVEKETLTSLFFCENSCKPVDTEGSYIGIGQMGVEAIQDAIDKAERLYNKAINRGVSTEELENNFYVKNIIGKDAQTLFEESKTNPKICGALSAASLAWISDSLYTAFGENKDIIIMSYNAGIGNMQNLYMEKGIVTLSPDKKHVAIDLSKVNTLSEKQLSKFNEAISYLIRVNGGSKLLKENPNADILEILEKYRVAVGKNLNYDKNNTNQFNYAPDDVTITGMDFEMER